MDLFLEKYNLPKLNEVQAESLNSPLTPDEIETGFRKLQIHKSLDQTVSEENSTQHLRGS